MALNSYCLPWKLGWLCVYTLHFLSCGLPYPYQIFHCSPISFRSWLFLQCCSQGEPGCQVKEKGYPVSELMILIWSWRRGSQWQSVHFHCPCTVDVAIPIDRVQFKILHVNRLISLEPTAGTILPTIAILMVGFLSQILIFNNWDDL